MNGIFEMGGNVLSRGCVVVLAAAVAAAGGGTSAVANSLPQPGDIVFALNTGNGFTSLELLRGADLAGGGVSQPDFWNQRAVDVVFDNIDGIQSNANGNLLGITFSGDVYNLSTTNASVATGQLISTAGNYTAGGITDIDVSPDNQTVALTSIFGNLVIFADYSAGNTQGTGALLSNFRETGAVYDSVSAGAGVTWLDNQNALAFGANGELFTIDKDSTTKTVLSDLALDPASTQNTAVVYEPEISDYVFAAKSVFGGPGTSNTVYVFDPSNDYALVNTIDLTAAFSTLRDMELDPEGNLYFSDFAHTVNLLPGVAGAELTIDGTNASQWYATSGSEFNAIGIAFGGEIIPEPSTAMLGGLILLSIMSARRFIDCHK